jgi:hypothetical protein
MRSQWLIWSFIPGLHWLTWMRAAILTRQSRYYWFGFLYALPLLLYVWLRRVPLSFLLLSWGLSLLHVHLLKRDIDRQIAATAAPTVSDRQALMQALLQAALIHRGCLSVTQGVMETGKPFQEVENALQEMLASGYVFTRNNPETGVLEYVFKELL